MDKVSIVESGSDDAREQCRIQEAMVPFEMPKAKGILKEEEDSYVVQGGMVIKATASSQPAQQVSFAVPKERGLHEPLEEPQYQRRLYRKGNWAKLEVIWRNRSDHPDILPHDYVFLYLLGNNSKLPRTKQTSGQDRESGASGLV